MENNRAGKKIYEFEGFRLDTREAELKRGAERLALTPKAVELLTILIERRGQTVGREEILNQLWQDTYVDESNLTVTVSMLRKVFGTRANDRRFIETVPKRGYRFNANVKEIGDEMVVERQTKTRVKIETIEDENAEGATAVKQLNRQMRRQSLALAGIAVFLVGAILIFYFTRGANQKAQTVFADSNQPRTIAVLPLKNLSGDANETLSVGLSDALISKLGNVKSLVVRPTSAVLPFASNRETPQAVAEKLNVETILDGTIQQSGDRVRVSVQLVRAVDNQVLWAGNFNEQATDLFRFQDAFARQISDALPLQISGEERARLTRRETESRAAYDAYLKGRYFWNKRNLGSDENLQKAISTLR